MDAIVVVREHTDKGFAFSARKLDAEVLSTGGWVTEFAGVGDVFVFPNEEKFRKAFPNAPRQKGTWWRMEWQEG